MSLSDFWDYLRNREQHEQRRFVILPWKIFAHETGIV